MSHWCFFVGGGKKAGGDKEETQCAHAPPPPPPPLPPFFSSRKADGPYDSRVLPVALASALIVMLLLVFGGAVAELVGK